MSLSWWDGKTVLITGGTGSFGSAFARWTLSQRVHKVIVYSRDEAKQETMAERISDGRVRFLLGDVRDPEALGHALRGVDVVIHAAALKRVPSLEYAPMEGLKTNVLGTVNVINAAIHQSVSTVMALSSDKAAAPHNLYGKTKALAEALLIGANSLSGATGPSFSVVRYGNVAGSRGSLIPRLVSQRESGVVTLTDGRMTRFWITINEAVSFVAERIPEETRAICVPLLPSVRVMDVIAAVAPEAEVRTVGIRAGEKLHEQLVTIEESPSARLCADHYRIGVGASGPEFCYRSDTNEHWLSLEHIRAAIEDMALAA